jgi:hypothetical protein
MGFSLHISDEVLARLGVGGSSLVTMMSIVPYKMDDDERLI